MAIFFGISGGLTAIGPIAGGFLTEWTWRSIFWINIPVALIALYLIWRSKPDDTRRPTPLDYRGTVLVTAARANPRTRGAKPAVVGGCVISAVGFYLLAGKLTDLSLGAQWFYVALAGGGVGLMLGTASTDAVNRAPSSSYSEVTGITQTARNFGASLGLAVLGAILVSENTTNVTNALTKIGATKAQAHAVASSLGSEAAAGSAAGQPRAAVHSVQLAFAHSTQTVFYIMAGVMAATFLVALRRLPPGRVETHEELAAPAAGDAGA